MPWLCVNKDGTELIFNDVKTPIRNKIIKEWVQWSFPAEYDKNWANIELPEGTIEKLIGKKLTWANWPVKI